MLSIYTCSMLAHPAKVGQIGVIVKNNLSPVASITNQAWHCHSASRQKVSAHYRIQELPYLKSLPYVVECVPTLQTKNPYSQIYIVIKSVSKLYKSVNMPTLMLIVKQTIIFL